MTSNEESRLIREYARKERSQIHTAVPGEIVSYEAGVAAVRPLLPYVAADGRELPAPVIVGVPVVMPTCAGGTVGVSLPMRPGDGVLIVYAERQLDDWRGGDESVDGRMHDMTDAIAIPGCWSHGVPENASGNLVLFGGGVRAEFVGGVIHVSGDVVANGISLTGHRHTGVTSGPGQTGGPV